MNTTDTFAAIGDCILSSTATAQEQQAALAKFSGLCSRIGGVYPDPCFDAWSGDSLLNNGVAISPQAAAHCVADCRRSVVYIRGLYAAICAAQARFATAIAAPDDPVSSSSIPLRILYAGCGPYATLLLPLLHRFVPGTLQLVLLDIHEESLNSVQQLVNSAGYAEHDLSLVRADASTYYRPQPLHLIVVETMQKALEQEPQVPITRQLAPQLVEGGLLVPQSIEVSLLLQRNDELMPLAALLTLNASCTLESVRVQIPNVTGLRQWRPVLHTCITVYGEHQLAVGEAESTLARPFPELSPLVAGQCWDIDYKTGPYPCFEASPVAN